VDAVTERHEQPQPRDLDTGERLVTTGKAVADAIAHKAKGTHEGDEAARQHVDPGDVDRVIEDWPAGPKGIARQMIEKYGPPNEATPTKLFWYRNSPWKRTIVDRDTVTHNWPTVHSDFLTQVIDYRVPPDLFDDVAKFDGSILVDRTRGEVAARCDSEAANVLGINMVHEIATGKRTWQEAREISTHNTVAYNIGRNAPYAERLLFEVPQGGTEDLDEGMISGPMLQQAARKANDLITGSDKEATDRLSGQDAPRGS
jgi:hypothetical protein